MDDRTLDLLLSEALAPPEGPADRTFVVRVERAVAEAERFRRLRARLLGHFAIEALVLGAVAASFALIAQAPPVHEALVRAPELGWTGLLGLVVMWILVRGRSALA